MTKREAPDFLLEDRSRQVGIEVGRALPTRQAAVSAYWRTTEQPLLGAGAALITDRPLTKSDVALPYLSGGGEGYVGHQEEELRSKIVANRVRAKLAASAKYEHFGHNVLYIIEAYHDAGYEDDIMINIVKADIPSILEADTSGWINELMIDTGRQVVRLHPASEKTSGMRTEFDSHA